MNKTFLLTIGLLSSVNISTPASAAPVRVKELVDIQGVRDNALYGYGLVVGLAGTGDSQM
jgi:flagellar P-ring protein precursor FlgI